MFHVIIDRPRTGGNGGKSVPGKGYKKKLRKAGEDAPRKESMMTPYLKFGDRPKSLNEHLSPLYKYIRKQVGRPWNKVHSEICKNLSVRSAVKSHVRDHAEQYVEQDVVMVGKRAHHKVGSRYRWNGGELNAGELYVNPNTGLLCIQKAQKVQKKPKPITTLPSEDKLRQYRQIKGIWYEVVFKDDLPPKKDIQYDFTKRVWTYGRIYTSTHGAFMHHPIGERWPKFCDLLLGWVRREELEEEYGREMRAVSKRQLNKREIKRLGLTTAYKM